MKKSKFNLENLTVNSFVTKLDTVRGGADYVVSSNNTYGDTRDPLCTAKGCPASELIRC